MNTRSIHWLLLLVSIFGILAACKLADPAVLKQITSPTATPVPTDPPTPTYTTAPSPTPPPSDTPLPPTGAPTSAPTATLIPTQPPSTDAPAATIENISSSAQVQIINGLGANIKVVLTGPSQRAFTVFGLGKLDVELEPGAYNYTITASGYLPLNGTITFKPGANSWSIGKN